FFLKYLNDHANLPNLTLEKILNEVGSDCVFFLKNKPAFVSQTGAELEEISFGIEGLYIVLIQPDISVSTIEAYSNCIPKGEHLDRTTLNDESTWKATLLNDFEQTVFSTYPELEQIKLELVRRGAMYASMSGSGSVIYGLFNEEQKLDW